MSDVLFIAWLAMLVALPFVTVAGLASLTSHSEHARIVNLTAFGVGVGCAVFIVTNEVATEWLGVQRESAESVGASMLVMATLIVSIPCALLAARGAVVARRQDHIRRRM